MSFNNSLRKGNVALAVRGLGKHYRIARNARPGATTLAETLLSAFRGGGETTYTEFWANRDVSFDLYEGDVVGVVGRNGAGKSTLLKLLSRITEPSEGEIDLYGRVGSLLEVGTGFHPELTGRENIFLNGAILGMTRPEIIRQFDAIVEFAEVEQFLDTPVKRYSSGMYVRLAFAVAAHLNPEILIVDEVLAVGDAAFQRKCLGKMQDVAKEGGRTVLFVSHNMAAVRSLCNRALFMKQGRLTIDAVTDEVVAEYNREGGSSGAAVNWAPEQASSSDLRFISARVQNAAGEVGGVISCTEPLTIEVEYDVLRPLSHVRVAIHLFSQDGIPLCCCFAGDWSAREGKVGHYVDRCTLPAYTLNGGTFPIRFDADVPGDRVLVQTPTDLQVIMEDISGHGLTAEKLPGLIRPNFIWETITS